MHQIFDTLTDKLRVKALGKPPGKGRQDIINVMFPDKPGMDFHRSVRKDISKCCRLDDTLYPGPHIGRNVNGIGNNFTFVNPALALSIIIVHINDDTADEKDF